MALAPTVTNLQELINVGNGKKKYSNIDMVMLKKIMPHLEELNNLIGLSDIKTSITKQIMYYLSHFHLPKEQSFLYKNVKKQGGNADGTPSEKRVNKRASDSEISKKNKKQKTKESKKRKRSRSRRSSKRNSKKRRTSTSSDDGDDDDEDYEPPSDEEDDDDEYCNSEADIDEEETDEDISCEFSEDENIFSIFAAIAQQRKQKAQTNSAPENKNAEYMNMVIYGDPGVGKSLVGSIIGKIFHAMGLFRTKNCKTPFRIIHTDDLIGSYVGQTAPKTRAILEKSRGGVIMLDEAYGMNAGGNDGNPDTFAANAIDTITAYLSENKDDICFILAGYEDDIKNRIFPINKGLERRFPWVHKIKGYSSKELAQIFLQKVSQADWLTNVSEKFLFELFEDRRSLFKNHAGDVERLFAEVKIIHAQRTFSCHPSLRKVISLKDIEDGMNKLANERAGGTHDPPPFMYL